MMRIVAALRRGLVTLLLWPGSVGAQAVDADAGYTLDAPATTSAGVFAEDGRLLRTLWSNEPRPAGRHPAPPWDRLDDDGRDVAGQASHITVLSNNVTYEWLPPIGNTSNVHGGPTIFNNAQAIQGMVQVGEVIYYNCGFNEHPPAFGKIAVDRPNVHLPVLPDIHYGLTVPHLCTDGDRLYLGGTDDWSEGTPSMVFALALPDESQVTFPHGEPYTLASRHQYKSVLSRMPGKESRITGLAVQQSGDLLFIARGELDAIEVHHKTTGQHVHTVDRFTNPREIVVDGGDVWLISGEHTVSKHRVSNDGRLSGPILTLAGVAEPLSIAVTRDGQRIAVADGATQQVRFYDASGTPTATLGQPGGYATGPDVADTKFMFTNPMLPRASTSFSFVPDTGYLFFQDDGKLWVGDAGNFRSLRFNAEGELDDHIMYLCWTRSMGVDRNDPSRVFANYLEFDVDHASGRWSYARNWMARYDPAKDNEFHRLKWVTTLRNGRTYALQEIDLGGRWQDNRWEVVELAEQGLRYTGVRLDKTPTLVMMTDGSLRTFDSIAVVPESTPALEWKQRELIGFDQQHNPRWGEPVTIASTGVIGPGDPVYRNTIEMNFPPREDTSSGLIISFEGGSATPAYASAKYHLGATRHGGEGFVWKTAVGTPPDYTGDYPTDGRYDMGNGVQYPGGVVLVKDKSIFWNYHGEFWKHGQTNMFQHVYHNGLMVGQFGVTPEMLFNGRRIAEQKAVPGMAGNNLKGDIIRVGDDYHILHGDEGIHGAIHRWKVSNLDSIEEHVMPLAGGREQ